MATEEETLESWLNRATNPMNPEEDWQAITAFANKLCTDTDGPQVAVRLLAHKIQSPQEKESLQGLLVLEHCAKTCDYRFHGEIGKFRFLNEMIKLVSPKYLGSRTSNKVKQKVLELLYRWTIELKQEAKIQEAYQMLKRQGVITQDPVYVDETMKPSPPPPRPRNSVFDDEEKSKLLQRLLQSKNPEDLQAANRLIKNMVKEEEKRTEKVAKRVNELETVNNNVKVLGEMLANYKIGISSSEEIELMKELFQSCEQLRPNLFRLASDLDEKDDGIGEILKANDELTKVMGHYRRLFGEDKVNGEKLDSKADLGSPPSESPQVQITSSSDISLLDDQLLALGLEDLSGGGLPFTPQHSRTSSNVSSKQDDLQELGEIFSGSSTLSTQALNMNAASTGTGGSLGFLSSSPVPGIIQPLQPISSAVNSASKAVVEVPICSSSKISRGMDDLDVLGQILLKQSLPPSLQPGAEFPKPPEKISLNQLQRLHGSAPGSPSLQRSAFSSEASSASCSPSRSPAHEVGSLANLFVSLESIEPSSTCPLTLYDKNGLNIVLHYTKNIPRPDVNAMVVTTISKNPEPIKNVVFQAAVPKAMKVKLQPPSATSLPGFNPILPPAAITQIMLIANPSKEKVRLKYKVAYTLKDQPYTDIEEVDNFPLS